MIGPDGLFYYIAKLKCTVFSPEEIFLREWKFRGFPAFLTFGGRLIYVTDRINHGVQVYSTQGNPVCAWGAKGCERGQFDKLCGIAVKYGQIYVCDRGNNRIQVFDMAGSFLREWQSPCPSEICVGDNSAYVLDTFSRPKHTAMRQYHLAGQLISSITRVGKDFLPADTRELILHPNGKCLCVWVLE